MHIGITKLKSRLVIANQFQLKHAEGLMEGQQKRHRERSTSILNDSNVNQYQIKNKGRVQNRLRLLPIQINI